MSELTEPYDSTVSRKLTMSYSTLLLLAVAVLAGTFLRISLLVLYPLVIGTLFIQYRFKLMVHALGLLLLVVVSTVLSFQQGFYWQYWLLSLYQMLPFLLLLFAVPGLSILKEKNILGRLATVLSIVAVLNNIVGFIQYIREPGDDSFMGLYSHFSISLYGLVILNSILFGYYYARFLETRSRLYILRCLFFLFCSVMGFYGAGLAALMGAFILTFFRFRIGSIVKITLLSVAGLLVAYFAISWLRPEAMHYYEVSIRRLAGLDNSEQPRKLMVFANYFAHYPSHPVDLVFGSGPGTFNSRAAFMAGSPYQFNALPFLKTAHQPFYFEHYAYPLWNHTNTSMALYQDGFRNQPFCSLLAFLGEYGLLFTLFFLWSLFVYYRRVSRLGVSTMPLSIPHGAEEVYARQSRALSSSRWFFKFLLLFMLLLLCIDNYAEIPEVMLLLGLTIKCTHMRMYHEQYGSPTPLLVS